MSHDTGNDLESSDILDFSDNCENFDVLLNADQDYWTDRFGNKKPTIDYALRMAGFTPAGFDFTTGGVLKNGDRNKCVFNQADQTWYSWSGDLPYNVIAGSTPGEGWKVVNYYNGPILSPFTFGAVGDSLTDDSKIFDYLENIYEGKIFYLSGKTFLVNKIPTKNYYANGFFKYEGKNFKTVFEIYSQFGAGRIVSGEGALKSLPLDYDIGVSGLVVAIGPDAMGKTEKVKKAIAIGNGSMSESIIIRDNIGIGEDTLKHIQSDSADYGPLPGTRMLALGSNSFRFATKSNRGVGAGRNTAQAVTTSIRITAIGANSMSSYCPVDWTGVITNPTPVTADNITACGADTLALCDAPENTATGVSAGQYIKKGDGNTFNGAGAGRLLDSDLSNNNKVLDTTVKIGSYVVSGKLVTVTAPGTNPVTGNRVRLKATTGPLILPEPVDIIVETVFSPDVFSFTCPVEFSGSGNIEISYVETTLVRTPSRWNTLNGARAGELSKTMQECTFNGFSAGKEFEGNASTLNGWGSGFGIKRGSKITACGHQSLRYMQNGSIATELVNSSGFGANTRVSGDNQIQLGDSDTTTYVFGTVQNRSDARDKALLRQTTLGDEFIDGLVAEEGVWDMRDDYFEEHVVQIGIDFQTAEPIFEKRLKQLPKDGSKKRKRYHQWFVFQKVKSLCEELGVDFGGLQDHSINGGCDVGTLGYDEFIPPLTAYVQRRKREIVGLTEKINEQEKIIKSLKERLDILEKSNNNT